MGDTGGMMLRCYAGALAGTEAGRGLDPAQFMPALGMLPANWEVLENGPAVQMTGQSLKAGQPNPYGMLQIADVMPRWQFTYMPGSLSFYQQYCSFINSIELKGGDPAYAPRVEALRLQVVSLHRQSMEQTTACLRAWNDYQAAMVQLQPLNYDQWYSRNWASVIDVGQQAVAAAQANLYQALQAWGGPDYQTIAQALNRASPLQPGLTGLQAGGAALVPQYRISPAGGTWHGGLAAWYRQAVAEAGPAVMPGPEPEVSFEVEIGKAEVQPAMSLYSGGLGALAPSPLDALLPECRLTFSVMRLAQFGPILPGDWFNSAMIAQYAHQIAPNSALGSAQLYGPGGVFNLRTGTVWVAYRSSLLIQARSFATLQRVKEVLRVMAAGRISPYPGFAWSEGRGGADALGQDMVAPEDGLTLRLTDNGSMPRIIGIQPINLQQWVCSAGGRER
jgi:hypothetical protein